MLDLGCTPLPGFKVGRTGSFLEVIAGRWNGAHGQVERTVHLTNDATLKKL